MLEKTTTYIARSINNNWTQYKIFSTDIILNETEKTMNKIHTRFEIKETYSDLFHVFTSTINDNNKNINISKHEVRLVFSEVILQQSFLASIICHLYY